MSIYLVVYVQKSDFYLINVFCVVTVVIKCRLLCLGQVVFSCFVGYCIEQDIIGACDQSYAFAQLLVQTVRWC